MALIATATKQLRQEICKVLGMTNVTVIATSPNKPNTKYCVIPEPGSLEETFSKLVKK